MVQVGRFHEEILMFLMANTKKQYEASNYVTASSSCKQPTRTLFAYLVDSEALKLTSKPLPNSFVGREKFTQIVEPAVQQPFIPSNDADLI